MQPWFSWFPVCFLLFLFLSTDVVPLMDENTPLFLFICLFSAFLIP